MIHLLDTNILIHILRGSEEHREMLAKLVKADHILASCSITITEVYAGTLAKEEAKTSVLVKSLQYLPTSAKVAENAGVLKYHWAKKGCNLSLADVTIAAVAMEHRCMIVTENIKDFPMPELSIYRQ